MEEISAGGVVIHNNMILILKKFRGEWVLPKGRIESDETLEETAIREVFEESGAHAKIERYIGYVKYLYQHMDGSRVHKTVHYFYMTTDNTELHPLREEGFTDAAFLQYDKVLSLIRHEAEKNMIKKAMEFSRK